MNTAKAKSVQKNLRYRDARFNENGCLQVWGGDI